MRKIPLEIVQLSHSITQSHSYAVVLQEKGGFRRMPIVIGGFEAQAIAVALESIQPSRPLTHDLMKNFMNSFKIILEEVIISDLQEGVFHAKLVCYTEYDKIEIDSRTSDALALAVRFNCPIYVYAHILDNASVSLEGDTELSVQTLTTKKEETGSKSEDLSNMSLLELQQLLNEVLEHEDYLKAIAIRDEINKRK